MRTILVSVGLAAVIGAAAYMILSKGGVTATATAAPTDTDTGDLAKVIPAPEFVKISAWVNSDALKLADLKGKVVVLHFWTNGCINCVHNYPHYRAWTERYAKETNFQMIGVHTPEFDSEKSVDRIKDRAKQNKLTFPIAVDNDQATWNAWGNHYWPSVYLVDKAGNVRYRWDGELGDKGYKTVTDNIDTLLAEKVK